jgi:uncharacterized protein YjfI (DUF2170 family)
MARERLALVQRKVAADARRAATEGVRSAAVWQTLDQVAQQAQEQAALMLRAYQAGELPLAEALTGRRLALEALLAAQSAQVDALQAEAEYDSMRTKSGPSTNRNTANLAWPGPAAGAPA